ncbi:MAG: phosphoribosylformylglycinamidine synthase subunit PurL [Candidatus Eremiobacteraeota bacterium]|nr:phosphoribosylformylglycinamidine synthase subunit PurL [Candidatus Eremiobacteraeota bacterium]MBV8499614.1 phosphoribosylformylglycinamidine synthase subunit PurL [Candidatus Eremiobacteraeota bacterium]
MVSSGVSGTANVALRDDELARIEERLGRAPSAVELHAFDAQWSEHCSYKSSRHHLKRLPTSGAGVVLGPGEDAGILHLGVHEGERYGVVVAHESHNHPSQVVPFEGAATGVGGIVRDVLCMGAEVIGLADGLRFGSVEGAHQAYVATSAVDGIGAYGNAIGVPNVAGDVYFDAGFDENCLVNVVALGIVNENEIVHSFAPKNADGWQIVLVGKATDPSGFGGASFSSLSLDSEDAELNKGAVQVPDPFLENVLMRASYHVLRLLRQLAIPAGFKDLGAGGIVGCSAEITAHGGYGAQIDLDAVNVAVEGMAPQVIAAGETQERLLWVVPPEIAPEVLRIYNDVFTLPDVAYNARAGVIGQVTAERRYVMRHRGEVVMDVESEFLTGSIRDELPYTEVIRHEGAVDELPAVDVEAIFPQVLAHRDVCSREPLYRRYDAVVRGATVLPRGRADAGVLAPIPGSRLGVALAVAGNPRYGRIDPRYAAEHAVLEAMRRVVAVGARPIGLTDCLNFGNPRKPDQYGAFVAAVDGLAHAATQLDLAFVSGNVSLYNESGDGLAVPASAIVAAIGAFDNVGDAVTPGLKEPGSTLLWIGSRELVVGGSVLADVLGIEGPLPGLSYGAERAAVAIVHEAIARGVLRSCRAVRDGGMLTALARLSFDAMLRGRTVGAEIDFGNPLCEGGGFLCEVSDAGAIDLTGVLRVGETNDRRELIVNGVRFDVRRLYDVWSQPLEELYP